MRKLLCVLFLASLFFSFIPYKVQAVTTTLTVDGAGTYSEGTYRAPLGVVGGTFANMQSDDGDTTVKQLIRDDWSFSACPVTTINSVTINSKEKVSIATGVYQFYVVIGGIIYAGGAHTVTTTYTTYSYTWVNNPATGVAWTQSDVDGATFGELYNSGGSSFSTYVTLTIDYPATTPVVTTSAASSVGVTTATLNGAITSIEGASCDYEGFVWGTTSHATITDNVTPPNSYTDNWTSAGTFGVGSFSHAVTGLTSTSTYYVRAFAHNAYGWKYGSEVSFHPIYTPTISTLAATSVATTTARLNASVTDYGQQLCDVQFAYDNVTRGGTWANYLNKTTLVSDNYSTGSTPYADITGLTGATTYYFMVRATNDAGSCDGSELTFSTYNAVLCPSSITPISTSTTISLVWAKGSGSNMTLIRYKPGAYPTSTSDGSLGYFNTGGSTSITGLTPGTTYYFLAYGYTGGVYSSTSITALCTTAGYDSSITSTSSLTPPTADSTWTQTPSSAKVATVPVFGGLIQGISDSYNQPVNYVWYFAWMLAAVGIGVGVYINGNLNIILGVGAMLGVIGLGVWWYNVVAGGVLIILGVIAVGWALTGLRRPGG